MGHLASLNFVGACEEVKGFVTPFFVKKKGGKQRLVLDCRATNQLFRKPFKPEIAAAESFQRLETDPSCPKLFEAEADLLAEGRKTVDAWSELPQDANCG